ncbi:hypothetical protein CC86DRAFT_399885 [Ophiobolus disseminans]|uniref:Uncharacterized protein n=1 Tax=Ophiobolus disseminans TaxID=1469910 RepID=A0A6A7AIX3_9PLEO|nr:hypothetical protein CC86DRAFT_399885 [Ophiobolus disseminans]
MADSIPYIPPEIICMIIATPNINLVSLLRCTRVSKEWNSLIYNSNTLRAKLFLPPLLASGHLVEVRDPRYTALALVSIFVDPDPADRKPSYAPMAQAPLADVAVHPLLLRERVAPCDDGIKAFTLSYRILRLLYSVSQGGVNSWRAMCVTEPPLSSIDLRVPEFRCDDTPRAGFPIFKLRNPSGVTIKDLFDRMWGTHLPRNVGLVPDDGSCAGRIWREQDGLKCRCYNIIGEMETSRETSRILEEQMVTSKKLFKASRVRMKYVQKILKKEIAMMKNKRLRMKESLERKRVRIETRAWKEKEASRKKRASKVKKVLEEKNALRERRALKKALGKNRAISSD